MNQQFLKEKAKPGCVFRADRMIELREAQGWTARDLAERVGVNATLVHSWEHYGVEPRASSVKRLARILETTTDYLLGMDDDVD